MFNIKDQIKPYSVSDFLDCINSKISGETYAIEGEVSKISERQKAVYFSIKDPKDGSILNCLIWQFKYSMLGVKLEEGLAVRIYGVADIYKPMGSLTFKAEALELVGEGALKKAYDDLKKKLEFEGLFAPERKREIEKFPKNIGLITSKYGDAIHDFRANLTKAGIKINFFDCRVEGAQAVPDIIGAIKKFNQHIDLDCIVITRGGGSWESLQAFNNEAVCRAIAESGVPVVCGIGHEKDVPLACLAADKSVSTPTAVAEFLSRSYKETRGEIVRLRERIISRFRQELNREKYFIGSAKINLSNRFKNILTNTRHKIAMLQQRIVDNSPMRQLEKGYCLAFKGESLVKSVDQVKSGDNLEIRVKDGRMRVEVNELTRI